MFMTGCLQNLKDHVICLTFDNLFIHHGSSVNQFIYFLEISAAVVSDNLFT